MYEANKSMANQLIVVFITFCCRNIKLFEYLVRQQEEH